MCELTHGMAGARHAMCESALIRLSARSATRNCCMVQLPGEYCPGADPGCGGPRPPPPTPRVIGLCVIRKAFSSEGIFENDLVNFFINFTNELAIASRKR
jgi:hypothetical protein